MAKSRARSYSRYTRQALILMGRLIRARRLEQRMTTRELAERAGVSRDLLYRVEKGDPACQIGAVFELAAIVGVSLFEPETEDLRRRNLEVKEKLHLLPSAARKSKAEVKDEF